MDLINKLIRRTNCIEEKIDLIIDGISRLPAVPIDGTILGKTILAGVSGE